MTFRLPQHRVLVTAAILAVAITAYCLAAEPVTGPTERDRILTHIDSLHMSRQVDSAAVYIAPYLTAARAAGDSVFLLPLTAKMGRLWAAFGQPKKGEPLLREAVDLATARKDSLRLCDALRWLGFAVEQQGRSTEAVAIYHRQRTIARIRNDLKHEAWALVGLAYRAGQEGRYTDAVEDYRLAVALFQDLPDTAAVLWALNGMGAVLEQNGQYTEAGDRYAEAAHMAGRIGYRAVEALAQNNQGALEFKLGDPGVALEHFRRARKLQTQISQLQDAVSSGTNEALCLMDMGRLDEAAELIEELLRECEQGGFRDREPYVYKVMADVRHRQGRLHEAAAIYRRILAWDDASQEHRIRIESVTGLAATLAGMDSSAAALRFLQDEETLSRGRLHGTARVEFELAMGEQLRETGNPQAALERFRFVIDATTAAGLQPPRVTALAAAARCERELGRLDDALVFLREAAQVWEDTRNQPLDPEWREQRGASGRLVYSQLAATIIAGQGHAGIAFDAVQPFKARTLAERIGSHQRVADQPAMTLDRLQTEVLKEGEVFLDAYLGPTESILFAVSRTECRAVRWPEDEYLTGRLRLFHEMLATPPAGGEGARNVVQTVGEKLSRDLLGPVEDLLKDSRRVIWAPDGTLNLVPLSAPGSRAVWTRVPSATILGVLRSGARGAGPPGHGLLAAAALETSDGRPLPGAMHEVKQLARKYRDVDLRLEALRPEELAPFDILHLASHARVDDQRPWSSEIVLDVRDTAGRIRADQIAELNLSARLAVLSACETGSGRILSGEGVLGLSSAFLSAGVPTVVASLWPVADGVTALLMEKFYEELARGLDPAMALAGAQEFIRQVPATAHPFHWAGFVVVGDGTEAMTLKAKKPIGLPVVLVVVVILTAFLLRKRS